MYSYLRDMLILFVLMVSTNSLLAQIVDIKLSCQIGVTRTYSNGFVEKEQVTEIFSILQTPNYLSVIPSSSKFVAVTTNPNQVVRNHSDGNSWDLTNERDGHKMHYIIDRNTGKIFYSFDFRMPTDWLLFEARGDCKKIDTNKKVF